MNLPNILFIRFKNFPNIQNRSEFVANGIPILNTMGMVHCDPVGLTLVKDQLLPNTKNIDVEVLDYNGQIITTPGIEIDLVFEVIESPQCIESNFWPGPSQRMDDPRLNRNMLLIEQ